MRHNDIPDDVVAICLTCHGTVQNVEVHFAVERKTSPHGNGVEFIGQMRVGSFYTIY
jgi:hypothetical protein